MESGLGPGGTFIWGCFGGLLAFLFMFALPWLISLWRAAGEPELPGSARISVFLGIFVIVIVLGGGVALAIGDAKEVKHAIAYGMGWQTFIRGLTSAGEEYLGSSGDDLGG